MSDFPYEDLLNRSESLLKFNTECTPLGFFSEVSDFLQQAHLPSLIINPVFFKWIDSLDLIGYSGDLSQIIGRVNPQLEHTERSEQLRQLIIEEIERVVRRSGPTHFYDTNRMINTDVAHLVQPIIEAREQEIQNMSVTYSEKLNLYSLEEVWDTSYGFCILYHELQSQRKESYNSHRFDLWTDSEVAPLLETLNRELKIKVEFLHLDDEISRPDRLLEMFGAIKMDLESQERGEIGEWTPLRELIVDFVSREEVKKHNSVHVDEIITEISQHSGASTEDVGRVFFGLMVQNVLRESDEEAFTVNKKIFLGVRIYNPWLEHLPWKGWNLLNEIPRGE